MKTDLMRNDSNYSESVNYDGTNYYNPPCTIAVKGKKFVLSIGSSDEVTIKTKKGVVFVLAENSRLEYISLTVINTRQKDVNGQFLISSVFVGNGELSENPFGLRRSIFDYSSNYKIRLLDTMAG